MLEMRRVPVFTVFVVIAAILATQAECAARSRRVAEQESQPFMIRMMGVVKDWLHRLHSLLVEDPTPEREKDNPNDSNKPVDPTDPAETITTAPRAANTPIDATFSPPATSHRTTSGPASIATSRSVEGQVRAPSRIQLARHSLEVRAFELSRDSPTSWRAKTPSQLTISTPAGGVLIASLGSYITQPTTSFHARFLMDGLRAFNGDSWATFRLDGRSVGYYRPFCFAAMYELSFGKPSVDVRLEIDSLPMSIGGEGITVAVFPLACFSQQHQSRVRDRNIKPKTSLPKPAPHHQGKH